MLARLVVDVAELAVTVRVLGALAHLGVGLQAVADVVEHPAHQRRAGLVAQAGQLLGELARRLHRPAQRRHRIAPALRLDQGVQHHQHLGIEVDRRLAARTWAAHPIRARHPLGQLPGPGDERVTAHAGDLRHPGLTATGEHLHHRRSQEPPLTLVEQWQNRREEPLQRLLADLHAMRVARATISGADPTNGTSARHRRRRRSSSDRDPISDPIEKAVG